MKKSILFLGNLCFVLLISCNVSEKTTGNSEEIKAIDSLYQYAQIVIDNNLDSAKQIAREMEKQSSNIKYNHGLANFYSLEGMIALKEQEFDKAEEAFSNQENVVASDTSFAAKKIRIQAASNKGIIYYRKGNYQKAIASWNKADSIYIEIGDFVTSSTCKNNIALAYSKLGLLEQEIFYKSEALKLITKCELDKSNKSINRRRLQESKLILITNLIGTYKKQGNYIKAIEHAKKGISLAKALKNKNIEAALSNNMADVYLEMEKYDSTEFICYQVFDLLYPDTINSRYIRAKGILATAYKRQKKYTASIKAFKELITFSKEHNNKSELADNLNGIGTVYYSLGDYSSAIKYYKESLDVLKKNNFGATNITYKNLAVNFGLLNMLDSAFHYALMTIHEDSVHHSQSRVQFKSIINKNIYLERQELKLTQGNLIAEKKVSEAMEEKVKQQKTVSDLLLLFAISLLIFIVVGVIAYIKNNNQKRIISEEKSKNDQLYQILTHDLKNHFILLTQEAEKQAVKASTQEGKSIAKDFENSFQVLSRLHGKFEELRKRTDLKIDLIELLGGVTSLITTSNKKHERDVSMISFDYTASKLLVHAEIAYCLILIVSEAIKNSLKHNAELESLKIDISLENEGQKEDTWLLSAKDNGKGFEPSTKKMGGLSYIKSLTDMIDGQLSFTHTNGVFIQITFKA